MPDTHQASPGTWRADRSLGHWSLSCCHSPQAYARKARQIYVSWTVPIRDESITSLGPSIERPRTRSCGFWGGKCLRLGVHPEQRAVKRICIEIAAIAASAFHSPASSGVLIKPLALTASDTERAYKCTFWFWPRKRAERERPRCPAIWQWKHRMLVWARLR